VLAGPKQSPVKWQQLVEKNHPIKRRLLHRGAFVATPRNDMDFVFDVRHFY
jgi:hypothetical protein